MSREAATKAVRRAVEATGLTRSAFAHKAKVDVGTLTDFLDGKRWAQAPTRTKIEVALGWPPGRIGDLADAPPTTSYLGSTIGTAIEEAIGADDTLHPAAKAHLINQLELLRLLPPDMTIPSANQARRRRAAVDAAMDARLDEIDEMKPPTPIARRKPRRKD